MKLHPTPDRNATVGRGTPCALPQPAAAPPGAPGVRRAALAGWTAWVALTCVSLLSAGCRTTPPLPPTDFSAPGWLVQQGQALWKPLRNKAELAGELLLATNRNGNAFIQFSKNPFPLATARVIGASWQIEFGAGDRSWRGRGRPPARFVWFQLPRALQDGGVAPGWKFDRTGPNGWRLENTRTGETLAGEIFP